jgi:hypothetical protein
MGTRELVTIWTAIFAFVAKAIWDWWVRRDTARERVGSELIHIWDRLIRSAVDAEGATIQFRYYEQLLACDLDAISREKISHFMTFFHKVAYEGTSDFSAAKSDLKRIIKDFAYYWGDERSKVEVLTR